MKSNFLFVALLALFFGCSEPSIKMPDGFTYKIINKGEHPINNVVSVEINKRLTVEQLKYLGDEIFKTLPKRPKTFIGYLLPGMKDGAWAITNYEPNLQVEIIGTSEEEFQRKEKLTKAISENAIGAWQGIEPDKFNYALVDSAGFHLFKLVFPDYELTDTVKIIKNNDETIIKTKNAVDKEYYKINVLGNLVYYNTDGKPYQTYNSLN